MAPFLCGAATKSGIPRARVLVVVFGPAIVIGPLAALIAIQDEPPPVGAITVRTARATRQLSRVAISKTISTRVAVSVGPILAASGTA